MTVTTTTTNSCWASFRGGGSQSSSPYVNYNNYNTNYWGFEQFSASVNNLLYLNPSYTVTGAILAASFPTEVAKQTVSNSNDILMYKEFNDPVFMPANVKMFPYPATTDYIYDPSKNGPLSA